MTGAQGMGTQTPGDGFGNRKRKKKKKGHKVVNGEGDKSGIKPGPGPTPMTVINLSAHKSHLIDQNLGLYRVILKVDQTYPKVQLTFSAIGEDEDEELLSVQKFAFRGATQKVGKSTIGPISLSADEPNELYITFENKEKMRLNIAAVEVK